MNKTEQVGIADYDSVSDRVAGDSELGIESAMF
jgi:hypothetical protein